MIDADRTPDADRAAVSLETIVNEVLALGHGDTDCDLVDLADLDERSEVVGDDS